MNYRDLSVVVTGGAGFIGSHLVDRLMELGCKVSVLDNLSTGTLRNLSRWKANSKFKFVKTDLSRSRNLAGLVREQQAVFHFAANPEVRVGTIRSKVHFEQNVVATFNLLEAMRNYGGAKTMVFASTSTVYGDATVLPTPENYTPVEPISVYGGSKLACESLISSYCHTHGLRAIILRLANIVGSRGRHGVIYDFINRIRKNPKTLEILGDGTQAKSYLTVQNCVDATLVSFEKSVPKLSLYNVGSDDQVTVNEIAQIVCDEMGLHDVNFVYKGEVNGRGWVGDVKFMLLDISKLKVLGWTPTRNSKQAVREATGELIAELEAD